MRTPKPWLWTALFLTAISSSSYGQEWQSPFRHLPENTLAVAHVRIDALLKSEWGKTAFDELLRNKETKEAFQKIKNETGIDPNDVESLTFLVLDPLPTGDQERGPAPRYERYNMAPGILRGPATSPYPLPRERQALPNLVPPLPVPPPPSPGPILPPVPQLPGPAGTPFPLPPSPPPVFPSSPRSALAAPGGEFVSAEAQIGGNNDSGVLVIVTTRKAINRKQFLGKRLASDDAGRVDGILFLNDNTFVVGSEHAIVQFAANTNDKESELGKHLTQEIGRPMIQGGYRLTPALKKALHTEPQAFGPLSLMFPLVNVNHGTFALDFGKQADVKVRIQAANERQANLAAQTVKTLLAVTEAACEKNAVDLAKSAREVDDAQSKKQINEEIVLTNSLRKMAAAAQVEHRHTEVSIALQMDIRPQQVVPFLQMMLTHDARPVVAQN